ncbi:LIC_10190 family membrane protein [Hymenobacter defluvii]|uniref:DUF8201 domain-containing protein n=1 Tax=Hymenobacter defluvii TaxID=2054411 RepID=A0ABS3TDU2_9BACT|nr:hypothetical protein [Hymenobacter defluvii]MBO3271348.1 hypothetical protein [Hymenobacter defluvii]
MLLIIVFWAWAAGVGLGFGLGLEKLLKRMWGPLPRLLTDSPELLIIGGLAVVAWLVAILSFALPVALPIQLGVTALAGVLLVANRVRLRLLLLSYGGSWQEAGTLAGLLAGALVALILTHAAQPPTFPDSALYHAQFIQWMHRYPLVPGLGNLRGQLAFNSHAHLLTAFFSPATPLSQAPAFQQTVSSLGFLLLTIHHVRRAGRQLRVGPRPWLAIFYLGSILLLLMTMRPWISSPLADSTAAVLGLLLLGLLLETPRLSSAGLIWVGVVAATAVTVKSSAGTMLLWPLVAAWWPAQGRWRRLGLLLGVIVLVLLPWIGRNVGLSGYLAYPLAGSLGPVVRDWAVTPTQLTADLVEIRLFARRPLGDWPLAAKQPIGEWLPLWWMQQEPADKLLLLVVVAGVGLLVGWLVWQLVAKKTTYSTLIKRTDLTLYLLLLLGCGSWFVAAPAMRFAYAYLIGAALLSPLIIARELPIRWSRIAGWGLCALSLLYTLNGLRHELAKPAAPAYVTWPADYPEVRTQVAGQVGSYPVRTGVRPNRRCGNALLPCTDSLSLGLQLRGTTLRQGFRMVQD